MKRASEVPPLVEKTGDWPVTRATVSLTSWVNFPGWVRKETPLSEWVKRDGAAAFLGDAVGAVVDPADQAVRRVRVVEADIERRTRLGRNHIGRRIADIDRW